MRFFTVLGSGTRTNTSRGGSIGVPVAESQQSPFSSVVNGHWRMSAQNRPTVSGTWQSMTTSRKTLPMDRLQHTGAILDDMDAAALRREAAAPRHLALDERGVGLRAAWHSE